MTELNLFSLSHILIVILCMTGIIYIPKYFKNSSKNTHQLLAYTIIFFIFVNQGMDLYREGYLQEWKLGLPLHLCDFSSFAVVIYLLTKNKDFFLFAFFFGITGGGMSILTPDTIYGFPYVGYIQNQIGHMMILLGVSYAMIIDSQRPYLIDVFRMLAFATILLILMYFVNYSLGSPANYWFLIEKPIGQNVASFMRPAPYHIIDIYILAVILCYSMYIPFYIKDRANQS
ncbi:MAG: hypothetical protein CBE02_03705 [Gammaproteobacteria bacterium TMED242]|nr:MAG: hypothetical protein CBE02_03705 [Gammaproteobacteria bacterium TMED242]